MTEAPKYEVISRWGRTGVFFDTAQAAAQFAKDSWPDQEQDETRSGKGLDIEVSN